MSNESIFAIAYRRASADLMEAVGSFNPSNWIIAATRNAARAELAAANIIEEKLATDLLESIAGARRLLGMTSNNCDAHGPLVAHDAFCINA